MMEFPREMHDGDHVSATEWNKVVRALRALYPIDGPGMRLDRKPYGTVFSSAVKAATAKVPRTARVIPGAGCFAVAENEQATSTSYGEIFDAVFVNQYYMLAQVPYEAAFSDTINSLVHVSVTGPAGDNVFTAELDYPIVALKIDATGEATTSLESYAAFATLQQEAKDLDFCIVPLYIFGGETEMYYGPEDTDHLNPLCRVKLVVDADLRNAPRAQITEII